MQLLIAATREKKTSEVKVEVGNPGNPLLRRGRSNPSPDTPETPGVWLYHFTFATPGHELLGTCHGGAVLKSKNDSAVIV